MRGWSWCVLLVLLMTAGCAAPGQENVRAFTEDGVNLYNKGDFPDALESFQAALAIRPGDVNLTYNTGQCFDRLGRDAEAETAYKSCLQQVPTHTECRHALLGLLVREGRWSDATNMMHDWLQREPLSATPIAEDAWLWQQYGDMPKARTRVEEALALDPHDNRALLVKAQLYEESQRPDRAVYLYEQALHYKPNQPDVVKRVAFLRLQPGVDRPKPD